MYERFAKQMKKYYIKSQRENELDTIGAYTHHISLWFPTTIQYRPYCSISESDFLFDKTLKTLRILKGIRNKKSLYKIK